MLETLQFANYSKENSEISKQEATQPRLIRRRRYDSKETELFYLIRQCRGCEDSNLQDIIKKIEELIRKQDFNINYQDGDNDTFLHATIVEDMPHVANLFLNKKIDVNIKNKKNKTPLQLATEMRNFDHKWNVVISELRNSRPKRTFLVQQMLKISDSGFISKTLDDRDYKIRLTPEDVTGIARATYEQYKENVNVVFKAIRSEEQLGEQLEEHINDLMKVNTQSLTFFLELEQSHWVTLVIAYQNTQFSAYRIDYFASKTQDTINDTLGKKIANINIQSFDIQLQQDDRYDYGIFALGGAKIINDALRNLQQDQIQQKLLDYKLTEEELIDKRIEFALQLSIEAHDDFFDVVQNRFCKENIKLQKMEELFTVCKINVNFLTSRVNGDTLLHVAVRRKEIEIVKFLKKNGARIDIKDGRDKTPIEVAQHNKVQKALLILQPPVFYKAINVPGDGSCLFWSVALAYLTPVKDDVGFSKRFKKLFGESTSAIVEEVKKLLKIGENTYEDDKLKYLITEVFRGRVVNEMLLYQEELGNQIGMIDFFESRNEDYFTEGTFKEKFNTEFSSEEVMRYGIDTNTL